MIEKVTLCVADESGARIEIPTSELKLQSKLDVLIADAFSAIVQTQQSIKDDEIRSAEKFHFALNLQNYLKEMKENVRTENSRIAD